MLWVESLSCISVNNQDYQYYLNWTFNYKTHFLSAYNGKPRGILFPPPGTTTYSIRICYTSYQNPNKVKLNFKNCKFVSKTDGTLRYHDHPVNPFNHTLSQY